MHRDLLPFSLICINYFFQLCISFQGMSENYSKAHGLQWIRQELFHSDLCDILRVHISNTPRWFFQVTCACATPLEEAEIGWEIIEDKCNIINSGTVWSFLLLPLCGHVGIVLDSLLVRSWGSRFKIRWRHSWGNTFYRKAHDVIEVVRFTCSHWMYCKNR